MHWELDVSVAHSRSQLMLWAVEALQARAVLSCWQGVRAALLVAQALQAQSVLVCAYYLWVCAACTRVCHSMLWRCCERWCCSHGAMVGKHAALLATQQ